MTAYLELTKPRIAVMVMATAAMGYWIAGGRIDGRLLLVLAGTGLASAACGTLNQYLERDVDAKMHRTRGRPVPSGRVSPASAALFGSVLAAAGLAVLRRFSEPLAFELTAFTLAAYLLAYTPLKRVTPHSTWVGSVAGATPPLIGWAAAQGALGPGAWVLFAIQFLWQIPHFLALFWIHREDYARAGLKVMPVVDPGGGVTAGQIAIHSFAVLPASLLPGMMGMAGLPYSLGALVLGSAYCGLGMKASWTLAPKDTRRLFLASLVYLPALFGMLVLGGV